MSEPRSGPKIVLTQADGMPERASKLPFEERVDADSSGPRASTPVGPGCTVCERDSARALRNYEPTS
jgi:predicted transcriptional regulator